MSTALAHALPQGWPPPALMRRRVVVLAGGEEEPPVFVRHLVSPDDVVLAADGGARLAVAAGLVPHLLVGDVDSITQGEVDALPPQTIRWIHPEHKDFSDLELALQAAFAADASEVVVIGAFGGRLDHLLVNVGLLHLACNLGVPMRLLSARGEALLVYQDVVLQWPVGRLVTVMALTPEVHGLVLEGFAYPVSGETLVWGSSRGLSNVVARSPARIALTSGRLLVVGGAPGQSVQIEVKRTYLEMRSLDVARLVFVDDQRLRLSRVVDCPASYYRYLYGTVGHRYHWTDRSSWSDGQINAYLGDPNLHLWVLYFEGAPAGFFELLHEEEGATHIVYLGLLPDFHGRGLGRHLLSAALQQAWAGDKRRVWLHTCTLDDAAAMPNYLSRGFVPYREELYTVDLAAAGPPDG